MLYVYEMMGVHSTYCDNHFVTYASQNVILYILNLYSAIRQLYLKSGRKMFTKTTHINFFSFLWGILSLQTVQLNYFQFFSFFRYCLKLHQWLFFLNVLTFHTFTTWTLYICMFPLSSFVLFSLNFIKWYNFTKCLIFFKAYIWFRDTFFSANSSPLPLYNALALTKSYQLLFHLGFKTNL